MKKSISAILCILLGALLAHYVINKQEANKEEISSNKAAVEQSINK